MSGSATGSSPTRRYDNSSRERQAAQTRARIVGSGAALLRASSIDDWDQITIGAVAARAGVSERTVYRHFDNEKGLRDAVMAHLQTEAGVDLDALDLASFGEVATRVLRFVSAFPPTPRPGLDATQRETDDRLREALRRAVADAAPGRPERELRRAAAVLDVLWNPTTFDRLLTAWRFDPDEAAETIRWAVGLIEGSIDPR